MSDSETERLERQDKERRDLRKQGWDGDRAMEYVRTHVVERPDGQRVFDPSRERGK